ncbi:hypothetical protein [Nocardioides sp. GXQ0305]|uniref:hypothetical protein n=1 Tax=Nocardioides sp. GXQ0305 TaxID=3423912 RepID=UPI003D7EE019
MADPLIQLEEGGTAPVVRYDIPEPTSYEGKNFIELAFADEVFADGARQMRRTAPGTPLESQSTDQVRAEVAAYLRTGSSRRPELASMPVSAMMRPAGTVEPGVPDPAPPLAPDVLDGIADQVAQGYHVVKYVDLFGTPRITTVPVPPEPDPRLFLVETLRMTSFLGDYGAGRIVKTFTLLPGEGTKISVKTFRQRESTRKEASSVLDSLTQESATDLEKSLMSEQSDQQSFQQTKEYYADVEGSASWGFGSASAKAGVKGSSNAAREESVKNVSNATEKHSSRASAKREVEVNTSYEVTDKEGEELATERQIENINLSRTLNFVFRQMNQEFVTLIHLTDVRIGFFDGSGTSRREVPISGLDGLLEEVVAAQHRDSVRSIVLEQLSAVRDRDGIPVDVVDEVEVTPGDVYRRFDTELTATYTDERDRSYTVPGVLLKVDRRVMRTEGVIVEALLGNGAALDGYAEQLQQLEVERREAEVAKEAALAAQAALVNQVIGDGDETKGAIAAQLLVRPCCCCDHEHSEATAPSPTPPPP